jgi:hypothetical protein
MADICMFRQLPVPSTIKHKNLCPFMVVCHFCGFPFLDCGGQSGRAGPHVEGEAGSLTKIELTGTQMQEGRNNGVELKLEDKLEVNKDMTKSEEVQTFDKQNQGGPSGTGGNTEIVCLFHPDSLLPIDPMLHPDSLEVFHPIYDRDFVLLTESGRSKLHKNRLFQLQQIWQNLDTIGLAQPLRKSTNMKAASDDLLSRMKKRS